MKFEIGKLYEFKDSSFRRNDEYVIFKCIGGLDHNYYKILILISTHAYLNIGETNMGADSVMSEYSKEI